MTWKLQNEIMADIMQIITAVPKTEYIVALIQWQGTHLAGFVYQPPPFQLVGIEGTTRGMSIVPSPIAVPDHWAPLKLNVVPRKNGVATAEDMPIFYFTHLKYGRGDGLVIPGRCDRSGRIQWSGNPDVIDEIGDAFVDAGIMRFRQEVDGIADLEISPAEPCEE